MANSAGGVTRRGFLAAGAGAVVAGERAFAAADPLRVGLIGCGLRGAGAAKDFLIADPAARVVAVGDVFADSIDSFLGGLTNPIWADLRGRVDVPKERQFVGLDAFEKVIHKGGVDVVLLAAPSAFRPPHLEAAVAAGKHVFAERSVAVDPAGVRKVLAAADAAERKRLSVVVGFNNRYDDQHRAFVRSIQSGAIGDITAAECAWGTLGIRFKQRQPTWGEVEFQVRNWFHFLWLSGDIVNEQLGNKLDVANWVLGAHPVRAAGRGSRNPSDTLPAAGDIRDQFALSYTYPKGVVLAAECWVDKERGSRVHNTFTGTRGTGSTLRGPLVNGASVYNGPYTNPYQVEMKALSEAIRGGRPVNDLRWAAETALTAVMGRMAAYSGKEVTWEQALNSPEDLMPRDLRLGAAVTNTSPPPKGPGGARYAVLAGVKAYDHAKLPPLKYTENDVTRLGAELRGAGFEVVLLTETEGKRSPDLKPTGRNIKAQLDAVVRKCKRDDLILVGFAGHGLQFEGKDEAYFCPSDARPFAADADTLISLTEVYRQLDRSGAGVKILVVDACRDDPNAGRGSRGVDGDGAPKPPRGTVALFSCSAGQRAFEHDRLKHGVFFYHLLEGLRGKAANAKGDVTWDGLQSYVREHVSDEVPALIGGGAKQEPNLIGNVSGKSPVLRAGVTK